MGADPVLSAIIKCCASEHLLPRNDAFFSLARSIVGQQISVKAAQSIWNRLVEELGGMNVVKVASTNPERIRSCGVTRQKSAYLLDLAQHFQDGKLETHSWNRLDDEQVIKDVTQVKGVGRWTAEMFLIFHLLRPNILPLDDIGLIRACERHYAAGEEMTREDIEQLAERWQPWRSVATWHLWRSLDPTPVAY